MSEEIKQEAMLVTETLKSTTPVVSGEKFSTNDIEANKHFAALSYFVIFFFSYLPLGLNYLGFLFLVPLLMKRKSSFVQFHAKQGLVLFLIWLGISFPLAFLMIEIPLLIILIPLVSAGGTIVGIIGIINSLRGKTFGIPILQGLAKSFPF